MHRWKCGSVPDKTLTRRRCMSSFRQYDNGLRMVLVLPISTRTQSDRRGGMLLEWKIP